MRVVPGTRAVVSALPLIVIALLGGLVGCGQDEVDMPPLSGPSGLALSIEMAAAPAFVNADGASTSTVTIRARDAAGRLAAGLPLFAQHDGDGALFPLTQAIGNLQTGIAIVTDGNGEARLAYRAGTTPNLLVTVRCEPYSSDASLLGVLPRIVTIQQR